MTAPPRGFPEQTYRARTEAAQGRMDAAGLSALLLTTEAELRYYTGFLTRFWESPTRPWFCVLPASGPPVAVIPSIGAHAMGQTWVTDIRCWTAPDYEDDGIGLLAETLREAVPEDGWIGLADGMESHLRMPLRDFETLKQSLGGRALVSDDQITQQLRMLKDAQEIEKIRHAAAIAGRAFDRVAEIARPGEPLANVFRRFQALCLEEGADWVPYLAGAAAPGGYGDVISPATEQPLAPGDVLMLDTGLMWDGYFCDFDRNYSLGPPSKAVREAHARLVEAVEAAFELAVPGNRICDLYQVMAAMLGSGAASGRLGHGLGQQLTEWPSLIAADTTVLMPGMVLTLEPLASLPEGRLMVHEENIVIRDGAAEYLSPVQDAGIRVLE